MANQLLPLPQTPLTHTNLHGWVTNYLDDLAIHSRRSEHTVKSYALDLSKFLTFIQDHPEQHPQDLTARTCKQFLRHLQSQDLSPRSIARIIAAHRSFWDFLCLNQVCSQNPWRYLKLPKLSKKLPHVLSHNQIETFLQTIPLDTPIGFRDRTLCELLYSSGIRVSECIAITLKDINIIERECRIFGKGRKERIVLFGRQTASFLTQYIETFRPYLSVNTNEETLFLNAKGTALTPRSIQRIIKTYGQQAGLGDTVTPHTFRHSFATSLYNGGANLKVIQDLLGHESITTTEQYTHVSVEKLIDTVLKSHPLNDF